MTGREIQGYNIYKKNDVEIEHFEEGHVIFKIKNNKKDDYYLVSMLYGFWNCDCADYIYRSTKEPGSFFCKHIQAAQFKLFEILENKNANK